MARRPNTEWATISAALAGAGGLLLIAGNKTQELIFFVLSALWLICALLALDHAWKLGRDE